MGKRSSAKKTLSLKNDFIPAKFVLFIFPFFIEALIGFLTMGSGDTLSVLIWSMLVFLFGVGVFPLAAKAKPGASPRAKTSDNANAARRLFMAAALPSCNASVAFLTLV